MREATDTRTSQIIRRLTRERLTLLVLMDGREVFRSASHGVRPLLELVALHPDRLNGALAIDRTVGAFAARVFAHLQISEVVAGVLSESGAAVLTASSIRFSYSKLVPQIMSADGSQPCPFELITQQYCDPSDGPASLIKVPVTVLLDAARNRLAQLRRTE